MRDWQKGIKHTLVLHSHLVTSTLWDRAVSLEVTQKELARVLGIGVPSVQHALVGALDVHWNRVTKLRLALDLSLMELSISVASLQSRLVVDHPGLQVITSPPTSAPPANTRWLRAFQIEEWMDSAPWAAVLGPPGPDDFWRRREALGLSRREMGLQMGVSEKAVRWWEVVNVPYKRIRMSEEIFGPFFPEG